MLRVHFQFILPLFFSPLTFSSLFSDRTNEFQVVLGGVNIDKQEDVDQTIPVIETIVHENYRETPAALYNDIGLPQFSNTEFCF